MDSGLPSAHTVRAALRAAMLIDAHGSPVPAARSTYILYPSDALYPPGDLRLGERLLVDTGLLREDDGYLYPTEALQELTGLEEPEALGIVLERSVLSASSLTASGAGDQSAAEAAALAAELVTDAARRETLLLQLARKHDEALRAALGLRGEEFVVDYARHELSDLGRDDLAARVKRLSAFADNLGYDVVAPRFGGARRLEVKTSSTHEEGTVHFFISRSEFDWGITDPDWALVACRAGPTDVELVGWCRASAVEPYLPIDGEGRWVSAEITVPESLFQEGLPPAV